MNIGAVSRYIHGGSVRMESVFAVSTPFATNLESVSGATSATMDDLLGQASDFGGFAS